MKKMIATFVLAFCSPAYFAQQAKSVPPKDPATIVAEAKQKTEADKIAPAKLTENQTLKLHNYFLRQDNEAMSIKLLESTIKDTKAQSAATKAELSKFVHDIEADHPGYSVAIGQDGSFSLVPTPKPADVPNSPKAENSSTPKATPASPLPAATNIESDPRPTRVKEANSKQL